jgi:hypothetical protein
LGATLVGAPLACMDLDGYHLDGGVTARGGSPPAGSGGRGGAAGAPRGGTSVGGGTGTCAEEVFTLYNNAADYESYSSSCNATLTLYSWAYVTDSEASGWLFAGDSTTRSLPFGGQRTVQTQCCWFDLLDCFGFSTSCNFYGTAEKCACDTVVTHQLTADTCPGEDVVVCQ